jgi:hypothetical protein
LTIYAAYHSMRSIDRLETERKNVRHKIWTASLARLVYWWDFRRSFFVDLMWTFGSLALAGAAAAEPVVQFATVPLLVLAATSLIRAFTMAHRRQ